MVRYHRYGLARAGKVKRQTPKVEKSNNDSPNIRKNKRIKLKKQFQQKNSEIKNFMNTFSNTKNNIHNNINCNKFNSFFIESLPPKVRRGTEGRQLNCKENSKVVSICNLKENEEIKINNLLYSYKESSLGRYSSG